jgi:hypothetical protein
MDRQQCLTMLMRLSTLQLQQFAQPFSLHAAHRHLGASFVVHAELMAGFKPRHDFTDTVDVHQIRAVHAPESVAVEAGLQILERAVIRWPSMPVATMVIRPLSMVA